MTGLTGLTGLLDGAGPSHDALGAVVFGAAGLTGVVSFEGAAGVQAGALLDGEAGDTGTGELFSGEPSEALFQSVQSRAACKCWCFATWLPAAADPTRAAAAAIVIPFILTDSMCLQERSLKLDYRELA